MKDLRDALEERGLDSKGVKAVLKERLLEALAKENAGVAAGAEEAVEDAKEEEEEAAPVADLNGHAEDDASMVRTSAFYDPDENADDDDDDYVDVDND